MRTNIVKLALAAVIVMAAALLIWPHKVWSIVAGPADLGAVDFAVLKKPGKPNAYLVCPKTICTSDTPDMAAPVFEMDAALLKVLAVGVWRKETGVEVVEDTASEMAVRFVQRTSILKFPDTISVRFVPVADNQSTLAIYSRSQIGYSDLGVNEKRVKHWLALLATAKP